MRGGWMGAMGTVGGMTRTYGLQRHFAKPGRDGGGQTKISRAGLRRIGKYFRPHRKKWLIVFACVCAGAGLGVVPPFFIGAIIDRAIPKGDTLLLALLAAAPVALAIVVGLIGVLQQSLAARAGQGIMYDLKNELFRHLQCMSLRFYTANRSGEIVSRINNDVNAVQNVATRTLVSIVSDFATLVITSIVAIGLSWRLAVMSVAVVPLFYLPSRIVGRVRHRLSGETQEARASLLGFLNERLHVGGVILAGIFGQQAPDAEGFEDRNAKVRDLMVRQSVVGRWLMMILTVFSAVGPALVWWYGGLQAIRGDMKPGQLVVFAALLTRLYRPLMHMATVYVDIVGSFAVFDRIFEYLDLVPEVADKEAPTPLPATDGHVVFEGVGFAYPKVSAAPVDEGEPLAEDKEPAEEPFALRDVSFEIQPGQQVALVGPSGAGKTTITYLLPRFYDPDAGRILLDGHDLRDLAQADLRRHIGMVTQETFLFHASIRENLLYARPEATEEQTVAACRAAKIHDFIAALPEGYDTVVGERGFRLSGGEKQRVSIARALLKDPAILILDEATSSLDATSEYLIQTALEKLLQGRTSLIIAHRLSTILSSDRIVILDAGRVVETGRHEQLLAHDGLYAELFTQQFGKVLDGDARGAN